MLVCRQERQLSDKFLSLSHNRLQPARRRHSGGGGRQGARRLPAAVPGGRRQVWRIEYLIQRQAYLQVLPVQPMFRELA